jgi:hypothetical protein
MYDYQLIALLLVLWTQPGDKTGKFSCKFKDFPYCVCIAETKFDEA